MDFPADLGYTKDHEWVMVEGDNAPVGITDYAQDALGDIVFVELPEVGDSFEAEDSFGTIEAVKTVADMFCPLSGEIVEINESLEDAPEKINNDCYGDGWIIKIKLSNPDEKSKLLNATEYADLIEGED